jgi:micrococcal nuclease
MESHVGRTVLVRLLLWLVIASASPLHAEEFTGKVVGISDGDTITVLHNGRGEKIRLSGIDCPEKRQPFGTRAKQFTSELAFGKSVSVVPMGRDRYSRTVADVFLPDNRLLNHELVREGLAWWYRRYALENTILEQLERDARKAKRGLWADKEPVPPWEWRHKQKSKSLGIGRNPQRQTFSDKVGCLDEEGWPSEKLFACHLRGGPA